MIVVYEHWAGKKKSRNQSKTYICGELISAEFGLSFTMLIAVQIRDNMP